MASRELDIGFDEYSNLKCSICSKRNKVANANYYCYDCQKHLCTHCLAYHDDFDKNHNVVQLPGDDNDVKCGENAGELITLCQEKRPVQTTEGRQRGSRVGGLVEEQSRLKEQNRNKPVKVNIKLPIDEYRCVIISCCHLDNGSMMIADSANSRLKLVDPSRGKVTEYWDTDRTPRNVCCIGPQEVAVAFGSTQVQVYNVVSLTRTRTIELGHMTSYIACHGGLLYCATGDGWDDDILYVHDVSDGRKLREFNIPGLNILYIILDIAVNGPGDRLYVTALSGLLCVNTDGQQIFHLSKEDLGLSVAQGVTTDHHGHVFVCGCQSNNVVMVTEKGHVVEEILSGKDGIKSPVCLSYDVSRSQLCVGGESDQILTVEWK